MHLIDDGFVGTLFDWLNELDFHAELLLWKPLLSGFTWFVRPNRPIRPLQIQWWCFCCCWFSGWLDIALAVLECLQDSLCANWNNSNNPELRVFTHIHCRILFCHIEKDIVQKSWVKLDHRLARYSNFSGKETPCSCQPQHCALNNSSHTLYINPGTYQESLFTPLVGFWLVCLILHRFLTQHFWQKQSATEGQSLSGLFGGKVSRLQIGWFQSVGNWLLAFHLWVLPEAIGKFFKLLFAYCWCPIQGRPPVPRYPRLGIRE